MTVLTKRQVIESVAKRWREQYNEDYRARSKDILINLEKLNLKTCSAKDIDKIIGNDSWTTLTCDLCEKKVSAVFCFERYDSHIGACKNCLRESIKELESA